ncbi:LPS assembly lipoprotein LptE [Pseudooceanicola sp. LIPI14-2-Ac024]|uniref:LPS assembly lipoprotein LptE n=1 Tax=Pseudooceanicola sp. LIPI14-2-Ac024 TaxID=3344875 RepID=UPI0035CF07BC
MWSPDRRKFLTLGAGLMTLGACGFTPVYGPGGGGSALQGQVRPADPGTPDEYVLVRTLETRLGRSETGPYALDYDLVVNEERMAITSSNVATRFNVVGTVRYKLKDAATDITLQEGQVRNFTSYSTTGTTVATQAARRDARERLMTILADLLVTRLYAQASDLPA